MLRSTPTSSWPKFYLGPSISTLRSPVSSHCLVSYASALRASRVHLGIPLNRPFYNWTVARSHVARPYINNSYRENPLRPQASGPPQPHQIQYQQARFFISSQYQFHAQSLEAKSSKLSAVSQAQASFCNDEVKSPVIDADRAGVDDPTAVSGAKMTPPKSEVDRPGGGSGAVKGRPNKAIPKDEGGQRETPAAYQSSIDRRRDTVATYGFLTTGALLLAGLITFSRNWDVDEAERHRNIPNGWAPGALYARVSARLSEILGHYTEPAFPQLLPDIDPVYRPSPYTLVLSLEDLLIHSSWTRQSGWEVAKRPGVDYFIRYLSQYYELVLFTSVPSMNGLPVYSQLDPFHFILFPLFREATRYINGHHVKDLSYLNRDLSKVIVIDTDANHLKLNPDNAVILPKWNGQPHDKHATDLVSLIPFLEYIAGMNIDDVRKMIKSFEGTDIPREYAKREARMRKSFQREGDGEDKAKSSTSRAATGFSNMLGFKQNSQLGRIPGEVQVSDSTSQQKMLIDQIRERGRLQYELLERDIQQNGQKWLEDQEREDKKAMEEQMQSMKKNWISWPSKTFARLDERE